jgi:hypothetical protein
VSGPAHPRGAAEADGLRAAWAAAKGAAPDPQTCPPATQLWEAAHGELPASAVARVVEHLAICAACAEGWRLALELEPLPHEAPARSPQARHAWTARPAWPRAGSSPAWAGHGRGLAAAAALLLALGGALWQVRQGDVRARGNGPVYRGAAAAGTLTLARDTRCAVTGCRLQWPRLPGATYRIVVRTAGGAPVLDRRGLSEPRLDLDAHDLLGLPPGTRLRWNVMATAGGARSASQPADLILLPARHPS